MILQPIRSQRVTRSFLVYDLEWYPGTYELRMVGVFDGDRFRYYTTIEAFFLGELTRENSGRWFYAHAGGLADCAFLFRELQRRKDWTVEACFSGSAAILITITTPAGKFTFLDSFWLLRAPLRKIGEAIGMSKGGAEGSTDVFNAPLPELVAYNRQDCEILWTAIDQFESVVMDLGGQLQPTIASCGMHLFRRRFLSEKIFLRGRVNECAEQAYFASRVEVIRPHCTSAKYYDVNSSFPYAMTFACPGNVRSWGRRVPDCPDGLFLVEADIETPEHVYLPTMPVRRQHRVFFPSGAWRGWMTGVDFEEHQRNGGKIRRVRQVISFERSDDLRGYAETIYTLRKAASTDYEKLVLKFLLNSLYGKFAEGEEKTKVLINPTATKCTHKPRCQHDACIQMLMPGVFLQSEKVQVRHRHVPFSAHITAIARRTLHRWLTQAEPAYYCDTDSIVTKKELPTSDDLGALKHEHDIERAHFLAPKVYAMDGKVKAKGFSRLTFEQFQQIRDGKAVSTTRMVRPREMFRRGLLDPRDVVVTKRMHFDNLPKRSPSGDNDTRPWSIAELDEKIGAA